MQFRAHNPSSKSSIAHIREALKIESINPYSTPYASLSLPYDTSLLEIPGEIMDADILVLIGIGGSNLGTLAVLDALRMRNTKTKELISLDTVDTYDIQNVDVYLTQSIDAGKKVVLTAISKSGRTAETIGIFEYFYTKYQNYTTQVFPVTISDPDSALDVLSKKEGWTHYNLPKNVGGRYSVLSHVGLFPLVWMGVDISEIQKGARSALEDYSRTTENHPSTIVAQTLSDRYNEGRNIFEHFFFAKNLENLGKWYRQLLAESVGKIGKDGKSVGITPTTSIGTTDLHSVAQLDLAHVSDRTLAIVSLSDAPILRIPNAPFDSLVENIRGKSFADLMEGARYGLTSSLETKDISYFEYELKADSASDIGYFLQVKMLEVILLGLSFDINPFDQPNVEDYKIGMREYLQQQ